jgi:hypothetical protein
VYATKLLNNVANQSMMKIPVYFGSVALVLAFALIYVSVASAEDVTTKASDVMRNASEEVHKTASELGKNASEAGKTILNNTAEVGKKVVGGAADVVSNISQEVKQGVGAK